MIENLEVIKFNESRALSVKGRFRFATRRSLPVSICMFEDFPYRHAICIPVALRFDSNSESKKTMLVSMSRLGKRGEPGSPAPDCLADAEEADHPPVLLVPRVKYIVSRYNSSSASPCPNANWSL